MKTKVLNTVKKYFFFKTYPHLWQLEKAIKIINENDAFNSQLSILGKFTQEQAENEKKPFTERKNFKPYWQELLGTSVDFGFFSNPEIGTIFIVGSLTSMFLHEIDGKALGAMSTGLYGIIRGLGGYKLQAETYLKLLNGGSYLLILRGYDDELNVLEDILEKENLYS